MKQRFIQLTVLIVVLISLAVTVSAYTVPNTAAPGGNTAGPITVGTTDQVKTGSLTVGTFDAKMNAQLGNPQPCSPQPCTPVYSPITFNGIIRGDTDVNAPTGDKPVAFGDANNTVSIAAGGNISATGVLQSNLLANNTTNKLCADDFGVFVFCPPPSTPAPLKITYRFAQPGDNKSTATYPNGRSINNYTYTVTFFNIKNPGNVYTLSNSSNSDQQIYFTDTTTVDTNMVPGIYQVQSASATCTLKYNSNIAPGFQFILDKNNSTANTFSAGC